MTEYSDSERFDQAWLLMLEHNATPPTPEENERVAAEVLRFTQQREAQMFQAEAARALTQVESYREPTHIQMIAGHIAGLLSISSRNARYR
jgi:hypothetical protein